MPLEEVVRVFEFEDCDASRRECVVYAAEAPDGVVGVREVRGGAQEDARDVKACQQKTMLAHELPIR